MHLVRAAAGAVHALEPCGVLVVGYLSCLDVKLAITIDIQSIRFGRFEMCGKGVLCSEPIIAPFDEEITGPLLDVFFLRSCHGFSPK